MRNGEPHVVTVELTEAETWIMHRISIPSAGPLG
jgi:hypothetical protein